jgi:hypothetical protein
MKRVKSQATNQKEKRCMYTQIQLRTVVIKVVKIVQLSDIPPSQNFPKITYNPNSQMPSCQNTPITARQWAMCNRPLRKAPPRHKRVIQRITRQTITTRREPRYTTRRLAPSRRRKSRHTMTRSKTRSWKVKIGTPPCTRPLRKHRWHRGRHPLPVIYVRRLCVRRTCIVGGMPIDDHSRNYVRRGRGRGEGRRSRRGGFVIVCWRDVDLERWALNWIRRRWWRMWSLYRHRRCGRCGANWGCCVVGEAELP